MQTDRSQFLTEKRLEASTFLDSMSAEQIIVLMNQQDQVACDAVAKIAPQVAQAVEIIVERFSRGGRLFYVGAGSSGRLCVLDASECPPTFRTDPTRVIGVIAGGDQAMFLAREGAEDNADDGRNKMIELQVCESDIVCGVAAGGTTPFVHGALAEAKSRGAATIYQTCVLSYPNEPVYDVTLRALVGPEVLTGSTRLKSGTATKLILNQLSTAAMVRMGKCYENLMVDLHSTNAKLRDRAARVLGLICQTSYQTSLEWLDKAGGHVKTAAVMIKRGCDAELAGKMLAKNGGSLRRALQQSHRD